MEYRIILDKIKEIKDNGLYNNEQIEAIKYACYTNGFDENLILDPAIPASIMLTYCKLATHEKIDISKYITEGWHLFGFNGDQLYSLIRAHSKGNDISGITPDMSKEQITNTINERIHAKRKEEFLKQFIGLKPEQMIILQDLNVSTVEFLLKLNLLGEDISPLLRTDIKSFSYEQVKYLHAVLTTGRSIEDIYDPRLSVKQMTEMMINSKESQEFLQTITDDLNRRNNIK